MLNQPGKPIHCVVSSSLVKIAGPLYAIGFLAKKHVKDMAHDRVCHGNHCPILPMTCSEALLQRREIRPFGLCGGMSEWRQDCPEGAIALAV
jgi:hypothetical protein